MVNEFIPHCPKFTAETVDKEIVRSTYEAIMHNVVKPDKKVLIKADATREDNNANNITRYMENHAIPLGKEFKVLENKCYAFTVNSGYMDQFFFLKTPEEYVRDLIAYLETLTPSQIGKDGTHMKIERTKTGHCPQIISSADWVLNGYRINRFLCNSQHAGCSWYLAEHVDQWYQDGTLIVVVKKIKNSSWQEQRNEEYFMYPETPLLFGLDFLKPGPREKYKNEICKDSNYILEKETVEKDIKDAAGNLERKQFVTITRTILTAMNSIHNHLYKTNMLEYDNFAHDFREFVYYFCGPDSRADLRRFENERQKKVFEEFWGNIILNYDLPKDISAERVYDVRKDIYWPTVAQQQLAVPQAGKTVKTIVIVSNIGTDQEAIRNIFSKSMITYEFEYADPEDEIVREARKSYVYTQYSKAKIGNVSADESVYVWEGGALRSCAPTSLPGQVWISLRNFFSRK